ncbi:MAG: ABC transporter ATP-binding protein [Anaerovoracaceae bacterium]
MSENNTVIKLDNVSKKFNVYSRNIDRIKGVLLNREPAEVKLALKNVSLEVEKGEHLVIFGIVDSGRSTLLKVISGITNPSKGKVSTYGTMNVMMDQKAGIDMEFSCRENIYMKANIVGLTRAEIAPFVEDILEFAEVKKYADLPMKRAPKGTVALISVGVHLYKNADLVICDEVFAGGGNYISTKCENQLLKHLVDRPETTSVTVTSRLEFAKKIGTRFIVLEEGRIVYDGNVDEAWKTLMEINKNRRK